MKLSSHRTLLVILLFLVAAGQADSLRADPVMQRIEETGTLRVGYQEDVAPFSYLDEAAGIHRGFSVDMAGLLVDNLARRFGKTIRLQTVNLKASERLDALTAGLIDIEMGASTQTCDREQLVDFSLVFFASETTFLVSASSAITGVADLDGRKIGAGIGTSNIQLLEQQQRGGRLPNIEIVGFTTHDQALQALIRGQVDAYCADRVLLAARRLQTPQPDRWIILEDSVGYEPLAFMIPEGNSDFRDFVNDTIRWAILTGSYFDLYEKWMGPAGIGPYKMSISFKEYLNVISYPLPDDWWRK